jgi:nicotinamide mononucleotide adenylyltransferase
MKLRQLFENRTNSVGIIFGRFNPPHQGHKAAWEMASENSEWFVGTNQSTQGPKDPLPYDIKVKAMLAIMPEIKGHIVPETSWLTLASKIYKKYGNVVLNVYTDEDWVTKALVQYNGKEGAHGFYNFSNIQQQTTPRLSSATALRAAVQAGDREAFSRAAGVDADTPVAGHPFFDVVAHYLNPYAEKEKAKAAKKKIKEPVAELSSELLGRYKKAAGADARRADAEGDYARGNKRFSGIVKATKKQFANDEKGVAESIFGLSAKEKGKIQYVTAKISDIPGNWDHKNQTYTEQGLNDLKSVMKNEKYLKYALSLTAKDYEAEGAPIVVALAPIDVRNPKKAPQPYRNQGDIVPPTKPPSTEKRGVKGRPGQRPMPKYDEKDVTENYWDRLQREKAMETAGVGIITKQNTTVDVNKNTPKKNLKAFRLI